MTDLRHETDLDAIEGALDQDGAVIVKGFLDPDRLRRLNAEIDALVAEVPPGSRSDEVARQRFHGANTKRFTRLVTRVESFGELLRHPTLRGVADRLLLPACGSYWLNTGQMMVVGPGEPAQRLHRDQDNWPLFSQRMGASGPEVTVSVIIALTDFTDERGATRVVPGSHRWDDFTRRATDDETVPATMPAGSAVVYTGKVVHGAGANRTEEHWRRGLHVSFVLGWLVPEEANPLCVSWEEARELPEDLHQLVG